MNIKKKIGEKNTKNEDKQNKVEKNLIIYRKPCFYRLMQVNDARTTHTTQVGKKKEAINTRGGFNRPIGGN